MAFASFARRAAAAALALTATGPPPALAREHDWRVASPDRNLTATVRQPHAGARLELVVHRSGRLVLSGPLGVTTSAGPMSRGLSFTGRRDAVIRRRYTLPTGKRRVLRRHADQMVVGFARGGRRMAVEVQVSNDGVAYRYRLPGAARIMVRREESAFRAPPAARAWLQRYRSNYEAPYLPVRLGSAPPGRYAFPALLELPSARTWVLLTESKVTGTYAASSVSVRSSRPGQLSLRMPSRFVRAALPLDTPWRVAVIGDLGTIVESTLPQELGGPSQVRDTGWIEPGRAAWSWWSDSSSPRSFTKQRQFVDFAARMGWEYVVVDEGWDSGSMPALVAYARDRGVRIVLWSRWSDLKKPPRRRRLLRRWRAWGVAGIKLDFIQSDSQPRMAWYDAVARAAALDHLVVVFHGSTLPRGTQTRWPNVITMEAVLGAEHYKDRNGTFVTAARNTVLPFTRNVVGSMDFTPVTFSASRRDTTAAHELALSVLFESGLQTFADTPESYDARPIAEAFMREVPPAWDDTRFLAGYPGRSVALARRHGAGWFIGAINGRQPRTFTLSLGFLSPGRTYAATVITDAAGGLAAGQQTVTRDGKLVLPVAAGGGAAVRLEPL